MVYCIMRKYIPWRQGGKGHTMSKEEVYQAALGMSAEKRAQFKAFLLALLENEDTVLPLASDQQESV